ncbi:class I SAM-dependent methyltransferase [Oxalobacteraceae bacterium A2-2]
MNREDALARHFDNLYQAGHDPWQVRERWYEQRKRSLLLASLPRRRYQRAYEPGCGNGELTAALSARCGQVLASDGSLAALERARQRLGPQAAKVTLEHHQVPHDWPAGTFDLIIISELAYYLDQPALNVLARRCAASLAAGGTLALCHWKPDFGDRVLPTLQVHAAFRSLPRMHQIVLHEEADFVLEVLSPDARSVASLGEPA